MARGELSNVVRSESAHNFVSATEAKKAIFIAEQQVDGTVRFISAGMLYESADPATIKGTSKHNTEEAGLSSTTAKSALTWVITVVPLIATIAGATIWVNSTIDSKARENRLEMKADMSDMQKDFKADMNSMKQDILSQNFRTQDSLQRISDRTDEKLEKISNQVKDLKDSSFPK